MILDLQSPWDHSFVSSVLLSRHPRKMANLMEQYEQVSKSKSPSPGTFAKSTSSSGPQPVSGFVKLQAQDEQVRVKRATLKLIQGVLGLGSCGV